MIITTLVEDTKSSEAAQYRNGLTAIHGVAFSIQTEDTHILFDMGPDSAFAANAKELGVDLSQVDIAAVSHGHYDHGGGLAGFCAVNQKAPIYLHSKAVLDGHFSRKPGQTLYKDAGFSVDGCEDRVLFVDDPKHESWSTDKILQLVPGIKIFAGFPVQGYLPGGNKNLFAKPAAAESIAEGMQTEYVLDSFDHEIAMLLQNDKDEFILITGCSHRGIGNIIARSLELIGDGKLTTVIGGFHLIDTERGTPEPSDALNDLIQELRQYPDICYYTGHCTGKESYRLLKEVLGDRIKPISTGTEIIL